MTYTVQRFGGLGTYGPTQLLDEQEFESFNEASDHAMSACYGEKVGPDEIPAVCAVVYGGGPAFMVSRFYGSKEDQRG